MPRDIENATFTHYSRDEVTDLIENPPSWLLRSGISMIALFIVSLLTISSFIKYPDKISARATLTSESPPIEIISKSEGYIQDILIEDLAQVPIEKELLRIKNTANRLDIEQLEVWIEKYTYIKDPRAYLQFDIPDNLQLGIIQEDYASLVLKYKELQRTLEDGIVFQQIDAISEEIKKISTLNQSQKREKSIYKDELHLQQNDFTRNESLVAKGAISQAEFERAKTALLQKKRQYQGMENAIIQNNIRKDQLALERLKLQGGRANLLKAYQFQIAEIISRLKVSVQDWSENYILSSPIAGEVTWAKEIKESKYINRGQIIAYVLPEENNQKYVSIQAPITNIGKLAVGQKIIVKFDAFPYKEFGIVETSVSEIGKLPQISAKEQPYYEIKGILSNSILTDFDFPIPYNPNMTASVEIITEDQTLIQRIFNQLLSILKK